MQLKDKREKDEILYLNDKIDKLFKMHPKFFTVRNKNSLRGIADNENIINYRNLSCKNLLSDGKSHEFNFFKRYGILYSLLEGLQTKKKL